MSMSLAQSQAFEDLVQRVIKLEKMIAPAERPMGPQPLPHGVCAFCRESFDPRNAVGVHFCGDEHKRLFDKAAIRWATEAVTSGFLWYEDLKGLVIKLLDEPMDAVPLKLKAIKN